VNTIFNPIFSMNPCIPTSIQDAQNLHQSKDLEIWNIDNKKGKQSTRCIIFHLKVHCPLPSFLNQTSYL
jgi:hypothetical protein